MYAVAHGAVCSAMVHVHAEDPKSPAVPALMQASIQGKVDTIEYLLSQGADVEQSDSFGFNPLHGCAFNQQADACAMMLAHAGVDSAAANSFHEDGLAPMHRACFGDVQADTLRVFLEAGMDRNQKTRCAKTFSVIFTAITAPAGSEDKAGRGGHANQVCGDLARSPEIHALLQEFAGGSRETKGKGDVTMDDILAAHPEL